MWHLVLNPLIGENSFRRQGTKNARKIIVGCILVSAGRRISVLVILWHFFILDH